MSMFGQYRQAAEGMGRMLGQFLGLEGVRALRDDIARQRPVACPSCDQGWHMPWWNKTTAAPSHWTNEMLAGWRENG